MNVNNNIITLEATNNFLKKYQASQLGFYGYTCKDNLYYLNSINLESDILKIVNYLNQEIINYELTPSTKILLSDISDKKKEQKNIFSIAKNIKNGMIDSSSFIEFNSFLDTLTRKLKSHQIKAAYHLYSLKNGANFSVPGSGKTSVVLSVYEKLKHEGKVNLLFVVGPPSSFQPWQHEFEATLGRFPDTTILAGGYQESRKSEYYNLAERTSELYLTTFHTILRDYSDVIHFFNQINIRPYLVIDEAHYMKQIGGSWSNSLLQISKFSKYRCILTGTPIPKSFKDVFNLFDFLFPENEVLTDEDKIQVNLWENENKNELVKNLLNEKIGPLFYRVRKKDLGLKEAVFHSPILIKMNENEKRIYDLIKSKIHQLSTHDFIHNEELLSKLWRGRMIRLRQCISYPKLLLKAIINYKEDILEDNSDLVKLIQDYDKLEMPFKLETLISKVKELNNSNQKVVIWSNFIGTLELIKKQCAKNKMRSELIYGKTPIKKSGNAELSKEKTREQIRDEFVNPESGLDILIANPAAASESISLHKTCFHAIYYDLSYNAAQYLQSLDRIHRVGGSEVNTANYYFLQYENSLDQDIKRNLEKKATKMYSIIEEDYEIYNLDMFEESVDDDIAAYKRIFHLK